MRFLDILFGRKTSSASVPEQPSLPGTEALHLKPNQSPPTLTSAQKKFLSGFLHGSVFKPDANSYWNELLHESPASEVRRLVAGGLLTVAPLDAKLEGEFKTTDIKEFLRERGLPLTGRKADCISRLVAADPTGMQSKVAGISAYVCTPAGTEISEQFLADEADRSRIAREQCLQLLQDGDVRAALVTVAEFERQQVLQRGVGVDWEHQPTIEDVELVRAILGARPSILKDVPENEWRTIQRAAAMMEMWGERSAKPWLPESLVGASNLDRETTIRMVMFAGQTQVKLGQLQHTVCTKVEVLGSDNSCPACRKMAGRKYHISEAPEVPCAHCSSEMGCRCMIMPIFE